MAKPQCVVLGGGFGGLAAAYRLRERLGPKVDITLVDWRGTFMMGLRILWTLVGQADRASGTRSLEHLKRKGIRYVRDEVVHLELDQQTVFTRAGRLRYDRLIVALGAELRPDLVPGYDPIASNLYDPDQTEAIAARIASFDGGRIGIGILGAPYKCPPAPFEAAFLIDDLLRRRALRDRSDVEVFAPMPTALPVAGAVVSAQLEARLAAKNIGFLPGHNVAGIEGGGVVFEHDRRSYDLLICVPPHRAPKVVRASGLTEGQWVRPNPHTCATTAPGVYAVGDVTEMPLANGMMLPKAGMFAEAQGRVAADAIADALSGRRSTSEYDGVGFCFIETGGGSATAVRGRFFAAPEPVIEAGEPSPQTLAEKRAFEASRLAEWF
jgi:sulfide:quinone oxidoreductase